MKKFIMNSLLFIVFLLSVFNADCTSNYYCADLNPQTDIIVEQLMGIWYGIEIISHTEERHYVRQIPSCPIIYLSDDKSESTQNPLYGNYNYDHNYGDAASRGYYSNHRSRTLSPNYNPNYQNYPTTQQDNYDRTNYHRINYPSSPSNDYYNPHQNQYSRTRDNQRSNPYNRRYGQNEYLRRIQDYRHIRLLWDDSGSSTEYRLRYNITQSGFWISSGPQNGSVLEPQFSHFAGTVQVIKAVGNHLVLTFCHTLPDKQLYTILLGRENRLDNVEIHGVHTLLNRKGLSTNAIKKVCNGAKSIKLFIGNGAVVVLLLFIRVFY